MADRFYQLLIGIPILTVVVANFVNQLSFKKLQTHKIPGISYEQENIYFYKAKVYASMNRITLWNIFCLVPSTGEVEWKIRIREVMSMLY